MINQLMFTKLLCACCVGLLENSDYMVTLAIVLVAIVLGLVFLKQRSNLVHSSRYIACQGWLNKYK